jgi:hypothetical protein
MENLLSIEAQSFLLAAPSGSIKHKGFAPTKTILY